MDGVPPDQIAKTLEDLTKVDLNNDGINLSLDVINQIIDILLGGGGRQPPYGTTTNDEKTTTVNSTINSLDNILGTTSNNCTVINRITSSTDSLLDISLADNIIDESPVIINGDNRLISGSGQRTSTGNNYIITLSPYII